VILHRVLVHPQLRSCEADTGHLVLQGIDPEGPWYDVMKKKLSQSILVSIYF